MLAEDVKYCPRCASELVIQVRLGVERPVCPSCDWIFFPDPKVAAAIVVARDGKILLVRRINHPKRGFWTLPVGFVDAGEHPAQTAERECLEETGLVVKVTGLLDVYAGQEHPRGAHILIVYQGEYKQGELKAGDDADKTGFFSPEALPPLAFATTRRIISMFWEKYRGKLGEE
jgi:ADP-ribose pyrophosphatase YjhB (NUDIX family)